MQRENHPTRKRESMPSEVVRGRELSGLQTLSCRQVHPRAFDKSKIVRKSTSTCHTKTGLVQENWKTITQTVFTCKRAKDKQSGTGRELGASGEGSGDEISSTR